MLLGGPRTISMMQQQESFKADQTGGGAEAISFGATRVTPTNGLTGGGGGGGEEGKIGASSANKDQAKPKPKPVRYRECLKNHAASIGGHALDGCGEFMPCGEDGTIEALKCAACDCHRNFHRREVEGEPLVCDICHMNRRERNRKAAAIAAGVLQQQQQQDQSGSASAALPLAASNPVPPSASLQQAGRGSSAPMSLLALSSRGGGGGGEQDHHEMAAALSMKKRFRTKFSMEQKEKMFVFAEKVGWRIQKHDEAAVQHFCAEVGVKRHVLKVWMHNNKHTFGKRSSLGSPSSLGGGGGGGGGGSGGGSAGGGGGGGGGVLSPPTQDHHIHHHHHHQHLLSDPATGLPPSLHQHQQPPP